MKLIVKQSVNPLKDVEDVRVMSYNIRMSPCVEDEGTENAWGYRLPKVLMILNHYKPDIIGIQEVSAMQMRSLETSSYSYAYKFLGRYPTKSPIESGLGIIYNPDKLLLISDLYILWLNESQIEKEASAWDASSYERYIIYAKFQNRANRKDFWFLTTHFNHIGQRAREESAKILMDLAEKLDAPAVITGDFNCFPRLGGAKLYQLLCTHSYRIKDSKDIAEILFGVPGTWIGWNYDPYKQREGFYSKYDFIFVQDTIRVVQQGVIDDRIWDSLFQKELYPSDHRPVLSDLHI